MKCVASSRWARLALLVAAGAALLSAALAFSARDLLLYNHSSSIPKGLYLRIDAPLVRGAIVTVRARDVAPALARARGFSDPDDRFIKRIAATGGDLVCADGEQVSINGRHAARRRARDRSGRLLPAWTGCRALAHDEALLLGDADDSFDGRYWGPVSLGVIEGVWRPLR